MIDEVKDSPDPLVRAMAQDMGNRHRKGMETYGVPLQPFNGRDAVLDAYEEALDLVVYAKQMEIESGTTGSAEYAGALAIAKLLRYKLSLRENTQWSV